jgi:CO/xanthine dehydrogenase FAD-binding subunit
MKGFDHYDVGTLAEALEVLSRLNGRGRVIAGGTDLMLQMRSGRETPENIVNIKRLPELKGISYDEEQGLRVGALTTLRQLIRSPIIKEQYPSLASAACMMASEQIRSFATVGGNLCNGSPSADLAPPLMVMKAEVVLISQPGERRLPLEDFFIGPGQTALEPGELLQEICLPPPDCQTVYFKSAPRLYMDIAVVGVAAGLGLAGGSCQRARIVLGAVAPVPLRVQVAEEILIGRPVTLERIGRAAELAAEACSPIDDVRGSAWYRRRMVEVLTRRALEALVSE